MAMNKWQVALFALAVAVPVGGGAAEPLSGKARVVSGDTLRIDGITVRLAGISAPPPGQRCRIYDVQWPCGQQAKVALLRFLAGHEVVCEVEAEEAADPVTATCMREGVDVGEHVVRAGHARARGRYGEAQLEAQRHSRGIWGGLMPEREAE